jgi:hypothetical protein
VHPSAGVTGAVRELTGYDNPHRRCGRHHLRPRRDSQLDGSVFEVLYDARALVVPSRGDHRTSLPETPQNIKNSSNRPPTGCAPKNVCGRSHLNDADEIAAWIARRSNNEVCQGPLPESRFAPLASAWAPEIGDFIYFRRKLPAKSERDVSVGAGEGDERLATFTSNKRNPPVEDRGALHCLA